MAISHDSLTCVTLEKYLKVNHLNCLHCHLSIEIFMLSLIKIHHIVFKQMGGQKIQLAVADPETSQMILYIAAHFVGAN